ncbi:MAG: hypothetical protein IKM42_01905 [Clostridia bacterium]|nr:hypothetical protein [Clostridia bacterium]
MKLHYLEPSAEIRFLLSKDIIAASQEPQEPQDPLKPETAPNDDVVADPF